MITRKFEALQKAMSEAIDEVLTKVVWMPPRSQKSIAFFESMTLDGQGPNCRLHVHRLIDTKNIQSHWNGTIAWGDDDITGRLSEEQCARAWAAATEGKQS